MASQSGSKTPTKQRNNWTLVEEKEFLLILCRELEIAEQLDNCVTSDRLTLDLKTWYVLIVKLGGCGIDREFCFLCHALQIRNAIAQRGLVLVGWYHSHPSYQPDPSLQDIQNQLKYQSILQQDNAPYGPCLGIIVSPYDSYRPSKESTIRAFWVQVSSDSHKLGIPMLMNTTSHQDQFLTQDLLNELRWMWSFYKGSPDTINFHNMWHGNQTYLDKVKSSLIKKFPTDQTDGRFLEFINTLLT